MSSAIGNIKGCSKQEKKMRRKKKVSISILLTGYSYRGAGIVRCKVDLTKCLVIFIK